MQPCPLAIYSSSRLGFGHATDGTCDLLSVRPWEGHSVVLVLSFFISKMGKNLSVHRRASCRRVAQGSPGLPSDSDQDGGRGPRFLPEGPAGPRGADSGVAVSAGAAPRRAYLPPVGRVAPSVFPALPLAAASHF